jgi:hypothetical protein
MTRPFADVADPVCFGRSAVRFRFRPAEPTSAFPTNRFRCGRPHSIRSAFYATRNAGMTPNRAGTRVVAEVSRGARAF